MRTKLLGRSGLRVSELCLGTMTFGENWAIGSPKDESRAVFDAYAEAGGNFLDTAVNYNDGLSETYLGEFLGGERERFVVATKYSLSTDPADPNASGNSRKNLYRSLDDSLRRLQSDYVDLLWVHAWDWVTPADEVMRALDDVVRAGKVRYVGISDTPAWVVARCNTLADLRGWTPFVALQIKWSLAERTVERELVPMARAMDLAVTPWGVLAGGVLTGKYLQGDDGVDTKRSVRKSGALTDRSNAIAQAVVDIAGAIGRSPAQVALAWLRAQNGVVIPILGARKAPQLTDQLGSTGLALDPGHLAALEAVSAIPLGFPHEFLANPNLRDIIYGHRWAELDDHRGQLPPVAPPAT